MIRCFLSHSSKDKGQYVEIVARKLGADNCVYDAWAFEDGMPTLDEILKNLDRSQLFVVFLSGSSLESDWVRTELREARVRLDQHKIKQFYPIIIDPAIAHDDVRVPEWIRENYNLKYVARTNVAVRRIEQRLRELSWDKHPSLKEKYNVFIGRNSIIEEIEERYDDFDTQKPIALIAAGLENIGRKSLLRRVLQKLDLMDESTFPATVHLTRQDSIEDFIYKVYDLGFSEKMSLDGLVSATLDAKVEKARKLVEDASSVKERIFVTDNGSIVTNERQLVDWFSQMMSICNASAGTLCIASKYALNPRAQRQMPKVYSVNVPEMTPGERRRLLTRLLELNNFDLNSEDFETFANLLHGFPEQVRFLVELLLDRGAEGTLQTSHELVEFNNERAGLVLQKYENNERVLGIVYLLSEFELVSFRLLSEIVGENEPLIETLNDLVDSFVCEYIGAEREYLRLNDIVREYIRRNNLKAPAEYEQRLREHARKYLSSTEADLSDVSDYLFSIKNALLNDEEVDLRRVIPSHFLKSMRDLYEIERNYDRVIELADIALRNSMNLDRQIRDDIQYRLCLSLIKKRNNRFLEEVQKVQQPEHDFLLGYFYRVKGNYEKSLKRLEKALRSGATATRAKRELVLVFIATEQYDRAEQMARSNYEENRENQYHIQAYMNTLLNGGNPEGHSIEIARLVEELKALGSEQALEMAAVGESLYLSRALNRSGDAMDVIEEAVLQYPRSPYPNFAKFDIALRIRDVKKMQEAYLALERRSSRSGDLSGNTLVKQQAMIYAMTDRLAQAKALVSMKLRNHPEESRQIFLRKLEDIARGQAI